MRWCQRQGMFQFLRPAIQALTGPRINKIQRHTVENTVRGNKSSFGLLERMRAAQKFERRRI